MTKKCCVQVPDPIKEQVEKKGGMAGIMREVPPDRELASESSVYKALSDHTRLKILYMLSAQPLCVCLMKAVIDMSDSKLSYHLNVLKEAGLIEGKRRASWVIYEVTEAGKQII